MNYLIICEKPSAARAFEAALGGRSGNFEGMSYYITNLYGHIVENGAPDVTAKKEYRDLVGGFGELGGIPWSASYFDFYKKQVKKGFDGYQKAFDVVKTMLDRGYVPVIASDIDAMCEGDLLVHEVLDMCGYTGKRFREYHVSEEAKDIQHAIRNMKEVSAKDPAYMTGFTRSNVDFMTQQLTRVATVDMQNKGYKLPGVVPFGRLKSVIVSLIGAQLDAIRGYKPSSVYESRYKLDELMLTNKDMKQFKTKEEWHADGLPLQAKVKKVREVPGTTKPPKPLDLTKLSSIMSKHGISVKKTLEIAQKLYENGDGSGKNYISYPRTEEDYITSEQFKEILPRIDDYITLLGLPTALFTHRTPRPTHVKDSGAHGALRPGAVPKSLDELDAKFGKGASLLYKTITERFLLQFLEDTEWVRHEYETETNPVFKGSVKIITKQGVVDPDQKEDAAKSLPDINNKLAELYPHEVKSVKPKHPTTSWLLDQLKKHGVGTPATQSSTVATMVGNTDTFPVRDGKVLSLSPIGKLGYVAARGTIIGSVEGTKRLQELIIDVKAEKTTPEEVYKVFEDIIAKDVQTLREKVYNPDELGLTKGAEKVQGTWRGAPVKFNKVYCEHEFTEEEIAKLLNDDVIKFDCVVQGTNARVEGKLENLEYKGIAYVGFKGNIVRDDQVQGVWRGNNVKFKKVYCEHTFTEDEIARLLNDEVIEFECVVQGKNAHVKGKLENLEYNGVKYVGLKGNIIREDQVEGIWRGNNIKFKKIFADYTFTDDEIRKLLNDETITISSPKGEFTGKLENLEYQGYKYVGFKAEREQKEGYVSGNFKGKNITFKGLFMGHVFTQEEISELLAGKTISILGTTKAGEERTVEGQLAEQTYQGRKFFGFKANFDNKKKK